ncbi:hypothetical protein SDC9_13533 [bioreactor metagenome]|uniref:VCBS repeat-containing protein n=1 Tax=bioreactor metagenome TaxID=1076179 RepID=A0A644TLN3_9ZZZZ
MKIESSTISMSSQHSLTEKDFQSESLQVWGGDGKDSGKLTIVDISAQAKNLFEAQQQTNSVAKADTADQFELSDKDKQRIRLIQSFIQALTGKKIKFYVLSTKNSDAEKIENTAVNLQNVNNGQQNLGWGLHYNFQKTHIEEESTSFSANGVVKTADGKVINLDISLTMSRKFMASQQIDIKAGDALKDPLVINFDAPAAKLSANKYSFDIDSNGKEDQISFLGQGSGFLALDLNDDGVINNGKELFGPQSGNGFAELAQYDSDGNNWIDESDAIYDKLRIWTKDEAGQDILLALGQKGIGAIYLGNVSTEFSLKDSSNTLNGQIRSTGIFLKENGAVGTMQHVDLAV